MKIKALEKPDGSIAVLSFAPDIAKQYSNKLGREVSEQEAQEMETNKVKSELAATKVIELDDSEMPPREENGVSCRPCWRIKGNKVEIDKSVRNIFKEIDDKKKEIDALIEKEDPSPQDVMDLRKAEKKLKDLIKEQRPEK